MNKLIFVSICSREIAKKKQNRKKTTTKKSLKLNSYGKYLKMRFIKKNIHSIKNNCTRKTNTFHIALKFSTFTM